MSYVMSSTAWTTPSSVLNSTARFRIERIGSGTNTPLRRVERVAEPVAHEVDAEHDRHDREAGEHRQPPLLRVGLPARDEHAERGRRRLDAEAEEREGRLRDDRRGDGDRPVDDDRPERVREDVPEHDPGVRRACSLRGFDVLLLAQREEDASDHAREPGPEEEREDDRDAPLVALTEERRGGEQDWERRQ